MVRDFCRRFWMRVEAVREGGRREWREEGREGGREGESGGKEEVIQRASE